MSHPDVQAYTDRSHLLCTISFKLVCSLQMMLLCEHCIVFQLESLPMAGKDLENKRDILVLVYNSFSLWKLYKIIVLNQYEKKLNVQIFFIFLDIGKIKFSVYFLQVMCIIGYVTTFSSFSFYSHHHYFSISNCLPVLILCFLFQSVPAKCFCQLHQFQLAKGALLLISLT